jgi:type II secretory pathway component PulF
MVRWSPFDSLRKLSDDEATELAARVAELTKAGLPLGDGLRALADELSGRRLPRVLRNLAQRLDAGDDLVVALESQGRSLPAHLRGLVVAGVRSGRLSEVLEEFVDLQRSQLELRHRVWLTLAYPFVLLLFMTLLAIVSVYITDSFAKIFKDFGTQLPAMTIVAIHSAQPMAWFSVGLVGLFMAIPLLLWLAPRASWIWPLLYRTPMLGPLLRWNHLAQFARLMGLLLDQKVAMPDALRLSAAGVRDGSLARGCRDAADDVERGRVLGESLAARRQFPASLIPLVEWGQQTPVLADAFRAAAEMFEGRVRSQSNLLDAMLLPVMFLGIITFAGAFITAMFLPLIALIQRLS